MLKDYFAMKKKEVQVKSLFYGSVLKFANEKKDIMNLLHNIYDSLKDVSVEDLRTEVIEKMAELMNQAN